MIRTQQAPSRHVRPFHNAKSVYAEHSIDNALQAGHIPVVGTKTVRELWNKSLKALASKNAAMV